MEAELTYRRLRQDEVEKIREIDRAEYIDAVYYHRDGELLLTPEVYDVKAFRQSELESIISETSDLMDRGGTVYGAFDGELLVGVSSVECQFIGSRKDTLQMALLHVSKNYRRLGVGKKLMGLVVERARELGAGKLYVSATESRNTVHFYQRMGCVLATEIDPILFAKEPKDIHLELNLTKQ